MSPDRVCRKAYFINQHLRYRFQLSFPISVSSSPEVKVEPTTDRNRPELVVYSLLNQKPSASINGIHQLCMRHDLSYGAPNIQNKNIRTKEIAMRLTPSIRETLCLILKRHGTEPCFSAVKCKMLLMDNCIDHKIEIDLMVTAIEREITSEMLRLKKTMPVSVLLPKLTRWLTNETPASDEDSRWVVDSWAMALDIIPFSEMVLPSLERRQNP